MKHEYRFTIRDCETGWREVVTVYSRCVFNAEARALASMASALARYHVDGIPDTSKLEVQDVREVREHG